MFPQYNAGPEQADPGLLALCTEGNLFPALADVVGKIFVVGMITDGE